MIRLGPTRLNDVSASDCPELFTNYYESTSSRPAAPSSTVTSLMVDNDSTALPSAVANITSSSLVATPITPVSTWMLLADDCFELTVWKSTKVTHT
ncbi:hypothetical protein Pelo_7752 [Pelomyxa schiedti]|nr:hypothetical protein Pelo_7752 [Pelomyxa schiedti]